LSSPHLRQNGYLASDASHPRRPRGVARLELLVGRFGPFGTKSSSSALATRFALAPTSSAFFIFYLQNLTKKIKKAEEVGEGGCEASDAK